MLLTLQKYRHVDNIMFENHTVADRFLDFWRKTGNQHFGYLYGRYTEHKDIPLGIRAEVAAIYEPPQVDVNRICCLRVSVLLCFEGCMGALSACMLLLLLYHLPSLSLSLYTHTHSIYFLNYWKVRSWPLNISVYISKE